MPNHSSDSAADAFVGALTQGSRHAELSAETLELLGKQAANRYLNEGVSLNEAIAKLAGAHEDINNEQVKRVVEFANTAVYLATHDKNKVAGASSSYPQFELADAGRIIQDLNDGARPTVVTPTDLDYGRQPMKKVASAARAAGPEAYGFAGRAVVEDETYTRESAVGDILDAKSDLSDLSGHLHSVNGRLQRMHKEASAAYYECAKRHVLDGGTFTDVVVAARSSGLDDDAVAAVVSPVAVQMLQEKVASAASLRAAVGELEKVAHRVVNPEHELVTRFMEVAELEQELTKVACGLSDAEERLAGVKSLLKEKLHAPAAR